MRGGREPGTEMAIYAEPGACWPSECPSPGPSSGGSWAHRRPFPRLADGLGGTEAQEGRRVKAKGGGRRRGKGPAQQLPLAVPTSGPPQRAGGRGDVSGSPTGVCPIPGDRLRVSVGAPWLWLLPAPRSGGLPSPQAEGLHLSGFIQGGLPSRAGDEAQGEPAKPPEAEQLPPEGGGPEAGLPPVGPPQVEGRVWAAGGEGRGG